MPAVVLDISMSLDGFVTSPGPGRGCRWARAGSGCRELELTGVIEAPGVTHLRYRLPGYMPRHPRSPTGGDRIAGRAGAAPRAWPVPRRRPSLW